VLGEEGLDGGVGPDREEGFALARVLAGVETTHEVFLY
jgi:hypothetical protein